MSINKTKTVSGVVVECIKGNIAAQQDITAVVNAANAQDIHTQHMEEIF